MTTAFKKGELVIMRHATYFTEHDGCLGVVMSGLSQFSATDMRDMKEKIKWGYNVYVMHPDIPKTVIALPDQLRRPGDNLDHLSQEELQRMSKLIEELISSQSSMSTA